MAQFDFFSTAFVPREWTKVVFWKEDSGRQLRLITLPPETCAVVFFWRGLTCLMQLQFLAPVQFFDPGETIITFDLQFLRAVCHVYIFIKMGTFNHCGRSKAWNSAHHGRYVFPSLRSAASLSSLLFLCVCLPVLVVVVVVVVVVCVCVCVSVFLVVFGASAMKVNAWTCAPATSSDLESAWRSISVRTRRMVNYA